MLFPPQDKWYVCLMKTTFSDTDHRPYTLTRPQELSSLQDSVLFCLVLTWSRTLFIPDKCQCATRKFIFFFIRQSLKWSFTLTTASRTATRGEFHGGQDRNCMKRLSFNFIFVLNKPNNTHREALRRNNVTRNNNAPFSELKKVKVCFY